MKKMINDSLQLLSRPGSDHNNQMQHTGGGMTLLILICTLAFIACTTNLTVVTVGAPAINCIFDADCTITVDDSSDDVVLNGMSGSGFLQTRTFPVGEAGTPGAGLYAYQYRIDLSQMAGITFLAGVKELSLDFGPVSSLDYNGDGSPDDVYVVTSGGLGSVAPSAVEQSSNRITFKFNPSISPGSAPGNGQSSFFFGLTSTFPAQPVEARIVDTQNNNYTLEARAPNFSPE